MIISVCVCVGYHTANPSNCVNVLYVSICAALFEKQISQKGYQKKPIAAVFLYKAELDF